MIYKEENDHIKTTKVLRQRVLPEVTFLNVKIKNERSKIRFYQYFGLFPETIFRVYKKLCMFYLQRYLKTVTMVSIKTLKHYKKLTHSQQ